MKNLSPYQNIEENSHVRDNKREREFVFPAAFHSSDGAAAASARKSLETTWVYLNARGF